MVNLNCKFLVLKIKELKNNLIYSTNTGTSDNTFILHQDKLIGNCHTVWLTRFDTCSFPSTLLENINKLSIEICDNRGERLKMGVIIQLNYIINRINHRINLLFGCVLPCIILTLKGYKINLPLWELPRIENWYSIAFNTLISHVCDKNIAVILQNNYPLMLSKMMDLRICEIIKCDITNNIFLVLGIMQNELNTMNDYTSGVF